METYNTALKSCALGLRQLRGDLKGNVLPLAAGGVLVMAALVGGAVDMSRAYNVDNRLQAACDAGVLAGRRAVQTDGFNDNAKVQAEKYFFANFDEDEQDSRGTTFAAVSEDDGNSVNATASTTVDNRIMRIFGLDEMELTANCSASMGVGNSDIMFVLDNTGSMDWTPSGRSTSNHQDTRMFALQEAMKSFYDTVAAANAGSNARIRYGFVPYSSSVNVGKLLMEEDDSYVADTMIISTRRPVRWSGVVDTWTATGTPTNEQRDRDRDFEQGNQRYNDLNSCNRAKPADDTAFSTERTESQRTEETFEPNRGEHGQKVTAKGQQQYQRKAIYECRYKEGWWGSPSGYYVYEGSATRRVMSYTYEARDPIEVDGAGDPIAVEYNEDFDDWLYGAFTVPVSTYKTGAAKLLVASSSNRARWNTASAWDGCIQERETTPASSFSFESLETGITPTDALDLDIDAEPTADENTQWKPLWPSATFRRYTVETSLEGASYPASTGCPYQAQLLTSMSEGDFDDYVDELEPVGSTYHDIGLLWGARLSSPSGIFSNNVNEEPSNSGTVSRHLIFMTDGELAPTPTVNSAYGIEDIDRRVTTDGRESSQIANHRSRYLAICEAIKARGIRLWVIAFGGSVTLSSDLKACASTDSAFKSDDADDLNETFQEIAKQVGELRVIQ